MVGTIFKNYCIEYYYPAIKFIGIYCKNKYRLWLVFDMDTTFYLTFMHDYTTFVHPIITKEYKITEERLIATRTLLEILNEVF